MVKGKPTRSTKDKKAPKKVKKNDPNGLGFVYIVKETELDSTSPDKGTGLYKIGLTNESKPGDMVGSIRDRITSLQTGNPRPLYFKGIRVPHMKDYELFAHVRAMNEEKISRIKLTFGKGASGKHTEWFQKDPKKRENAFVKDIAEAARSLSGLHFSTNWEACRR